MKFINGVRTIGVLPNQSKSIQSTIAIVNFYCVIISVICFILASLSYSFHRYSDAIAAFGICLACGIPILLNHLGHITASKLLLSFMVSFPILITSIFNKTTYPIIEPSHYFEDRFIFVTSVILPLTIFSLSEKRWLILGISFSLFPLLSYDPMHELFGLGFYDVGLVSKEYYFSANFYSMMPYLFAIAGFLFIKRKQERSENNNVRLILELKEANDFLSVLNKEKNNLIGIVAHDLKSPLNQIKGLANVIKATPNANPDETKGYVEMIESSASRLTDMIGKILDVEAIEARQLNLVPELVNFSGLVSSIVERATLVAQQKHIQLRTDIAKDVMVTLDRSYTDQIIENLISNAIKFSPAKKSIYITITSTHQDAVCQIRDEGPGLTPNDMEKLFGKYQKLSASPTGNETSTGLGLSIAKKFVDAMNGKIWCESTVGKGASFFVSFRLDRS